MKTPEEIEAMEKLIECMKKDKELDKKYINVLEHRLKSKCDSYDRLYNKYKALYEYANKLCGVLENQGKQIESLVDINNQLNSVNEQLSKRLSDKIFLIL